MYDHLYNARHQSCLHRDFSQLLGVRVVVRLKVELHYLQLVMLERRPHPLPARRAISVSGCRVVPRAVTTSAAAVRAAGVVTYCVITDVTRHSLAALVQRCLHKRCSQTF